MSVLHQFQHPVQWVDAVIVYGSAKLLSIPTYHLLTPITLQALYKYAIHQVHNHVQPSLTLTANKATPFGGYLESSPEMTEVAASGSSQRLLVGQKKGFFSFVFGPLFGCGQRTYLLLTDEAWMFFFSRMLVNLAKRRPGFFVRSSRI